MIEGYKQIQRYRGREGGKDGERERDSSEARDKIRSDWIKFLIPKGMCTCCQCSNLKHVCIFTSRSLWNFLKETYLSELTSHHITLQVLQLLKLIPTSTCFVFYCHQPRHHEMCYEHWSWRSTGKRNGATQSYGRTAHFWCCWKPGWLWKPHVWCNCKYVIINCPRFKF